MLLVFGESGLGFAPKQAGAAAVRRSNGFDALDWAAVLPDREVSAETDPQSLDELPKKGRLARKERKEQKRLAAAAKRRTRKEGADADPEFNAFLAKQRIKSLCSTLGKHNAGDVRLFQFGLIAFYRSDMEHVLPGEWLNDNNISFVYEALHTYFLKPHAHGHHVQLLFPLLVQLFLHYPLVGDLASILPMKELKPLKLVFLPLNFMDEYDSVDLEDANNGDHWALCVLNIPEKKLLVYDLMSLDTFEDDERLLRQLAQRLESVLFKPAEKLQVLKMKCDQQDNLDDCGVFVSMYTCFLVAELLSGQPTTLDILKVSFNPLSARLAMMEMVATMSEKA